MMQSFSFPEPLWAVNWQSLGTRYENEDEDEEMEEHKMNFTLIQLRFYSSVKLSSVSLSA